jgi:2,3-bisphosphoglycerate-dependent phosphoglycerate mutase
MCKKLILIRHGESLWNYQKKYTGWANINLTKKGKEEAEEAGRILYRNNIIPTVSYTSILNRSIDTNNIILNTLNIYDRKSAINIPIIKSWRLNEKHYGNLTGRLRPVGYKWIGNYFETPPISDSLNNLQMVTNDTYNPIYGESYYMTYLRVYPKLNLIMNSMTHNNIPLICAHKNSLRVIIQHIEKIDIDKIDTIDIPNAIPIVYKFDNDFNIISKSILLK